MRWLPPYSKVSNKRYKDTDINSWPSRCNPCSIFAAWASEM